MSISNENQGRSTQVKPGRRTFTIEEKKRILEETDAAKGTGGVGAILRREGVYSMHLTKWRRERDNGWVTRPPGRPRSTEPSLVEKIAALERQNAALQRKLEQAHFIIDVQKKVSGLLGLALPTENSESQS
jgi:transposase